MFSVSKFIEIDMGHRVPFHDAQCRFLHGHRWKIEATLAAETLTPAEVRQSDSGMVMDFGLLKKALMEEIHAKFDHRLVLWEQDPLLTPRNGDGALFGVALGLANISTGLVTVPVIPTSEALARYWHGLLEPRFRPFADQGIALAQVTVWETPTSRASYQPRPT